MIIHRHYLRSLIILPLALMMLMACAEKKPPSRQHIPLLRQSLQRLGEVVVSQNRAAIDSVLSVQILDHNQSSDSLLRYVYGPARDFAFIGFQLGEIVYYDDVARIDCFVADSSRGRERPIVLTFVFEHDRWLLKHFEKADVPDTLNSSTN
jgi:hypothetical protein